MTGRRWLAVIVGGVAIALVITLFSPFASGSPDGLERVADDNGFLEDARDPGYEIIPDYTFPGVANERLATILAGVIGVLIVAALALGAGALLQRTARARAGSGSAAGRRSPP